MSTPVTTAPVWFPLTATRGVANLSPPIVTGGGGKPPPGSNVRDSELRHIVSPEGAVRSIRTERVSENRLASLRAAAPAVLPSLLMCDFGDLRGEVARLTHAGAAVMHLDVMDGHFVPNLTYGMPVVAGLRRHFDGPLDVHLMISDPVGYARQFIDAGADVLTFHAEAVDDVSGAITKMRAMSSDIAVGVAINPDTPLDAIADVADDIDLALIMSVNAGFGGQSFNPVALEKIRRLRAVSPDLLIEIDGGIDAETIGPARDAGCDLFVVGSAIFKHDDYDAAIDQLTSAMNGAAS